MTSRQRNHECLRKLLSNGNCDLSSSLELCLAENNNNNIDCDDKSRSCKSSSLNAQEKVAIARLCRAFSLVCEAKPLDPVRLGGLFFTSSSPFQSAKNNNKKQKHALANMLTQPIERSILFAKLTPEFGKLPANDQLALMKDRALPMIITSASMSFDSANQTLRQSPMVVVPLGRAREVWGATMYETTVKFLDSLNTLLNGDLTLMILYLQVVLFSPSSCVPLELDSRNLVRQVAHSNLKLLGKYIENEIESDTLLKSMIAKLADLRTLCQAHWSFLADSDQDQLDPLMLAFV